MTTYETSDAARAAWMVERDEIDALINQARDLRSGDNPNYRKSRLAREEAERRMAAWRTAYPSEAAYEDARIEARIEDDKRRRAHIDPLGI